MDNTEINLENILEQAPNWTFAGDFTLLQWMNKISQDLETRANKSSEGLSKLNNNVRSINIGLDNVANSLTTLQFGNQFVEYRVHDDDETLANVNEATITSDGSNEIEQNPTSQEMLKTFLDNNLKILRNCHEKYSLDLDDSEDDDDEGSKEKTCIYQPINPYNEKPLPFIFGSKDWHAKWHVGLYENQQDNYSGDEISETFSESSTNSPTDDQESFESNTEWVSSNSIDNDNYNANIEVRNASSLRGSQALYPGTPSVPIKVSNTHTAISESSSISTPSSSLAKNSIQTKKRSEINTSRSGSVTSINSKAIPTTQVITKGKSLPYRTTAPPFIDLFAEPPEDIESTTSSSISSNQNTKRPSVDYTTTLPKQIQSIGEERPSVFKTQSSPYVVDLFAEPPQDIPTTTSSTQNIKRKPVNLFDDDNDEIKDYLFPAQTKKLDPEIPKSSKDKEIYEDDLPPVHTKKDDYVESKSSRETSVKTQPLPKTLVKDKPLNVSITPKSLFDDDDDENDDDFLKAFVKKSSTKQSLNTSLSKTLLFDNDFVTEPSKNQSQQDIMKEQKDFLITSKAKETKTNKINLFDDFEDDDNLLFNISSKHKTSKETVEEKSNAVKKLKETINTQNAIQEEIKIDKSKTINKNSVNLFDNLEEDYLKDYHKQNTEIENVKVDSSTAAAKKKINLFDDLEDDDDDFIVIKPKEISNKILDIHQTKLISEPTNINKDNNSQDSLVKENSSLENFIKPKEDQEYTKPFNKEYISQEVTTDTNKTKENKNFKEASFKQESNEQILSEEILEPVEKSTEHRKNVSKLATVVENSIRPAISKETKPILPQKVQTNTNIATKEQEITNTKNASSKNDQSSILNEDNTTKSTRETDIIEHTENPEVLAPKPSKETVAACESQNLTTTSHIDSSSYHQELNKKMSSDSHKKIEHLTTEILQQSNKTPSYKTDEKPVVSDTEVPCNPKDVDSFSSTTKYDFNSVLFLDEPPEDDSEFFETLTKSPLAFNTKNNYSIDLENELYEPELPKVPVTNANIIPTDISDNRHKNLYTGLQLFSDIPPDDDESDIQHSSKKSTQTKRLHSVFYDDFNETLMALNQNQREIQSSHTIFQNEPPPLKEQQKSSTLNVNKDVVDHKLPDIKPEMYHKSSDVKPEEKSEVVLRKSDIKSPEASKERSVSKLQMPNININVQALLPGANTALRKAKEDSKKISGKEPEIDSIIQQQKTKTNVVETGKNELITATTREPVTVPRTEEPEHILTSITKTRVRAPATRRPSTRRARQENYRKSLLEEEQQVFDTSTETRSYITNREKETQIKKYSSNVEDSKEVPTFDLDKKQSSYNKLFGHDADDGEEIFKKIKVQTKSSIEPMLAKEIQNKTTKEQNPQKDNENSATSMLFDDDKTEDDDYTLFKVKTPSSAEEKHQSNKEQPESSLIFDDDNSNILKNIKPKTKDNKESKTKDWPSDETDTQVASKSVLHKIDKKSSSSLLFDDTEDEDMVDFFKHIKSSKTKDLIGETQNKSQTQKEQTIKDNLCNQSQLQTSSTTPTNSSQFSEKEKEEHSLSPTNLKQIEKNQEHVSNPESNKFTASLLKSSVSFLDEDDNDDNLFGTSNVVNKQSSANPTLTKPETPKEMPTKSLTNSKTFTFLDNENDNDNTQEMHPSNPIKTKESITTKESNEKAKAQFKSFLDNESDNDDDFTVAGLQTTKSTQSRKPPTLPAIGNITKTSTQKTTSNKNTTTTLFTDSDTDSEDLFAKISSSKSLNKPSNKAKVTNKKQQNSSLFSDDSDGDDFLKTSESASKDVIIKSSTRERKAKVVPQSNVSLFSDIDSDEDDLFGGGASKSTKASTVKASANNQSVATTTHTSKTKTIADNPLADLL